MRLLESVSSDYCAKTRHTQKRLELRVWYRHVAVTSCGNMLPRVDCAAMQLLALRQSTQHKILAERGQMF